MPPRCSRSYATGSAASSSIAPASGSVAGAGSWGAGACCHSRGGINPEAKRPGATCDRGSRHGTTGARMEALLRNRAFVVDYVDARARWQHGAAAAFPPGTYWLQRFASVPVIET